MRGRCCRGRETRRAASSLTRPHHRWFFDNVVPRAGLGGVMFQQHAVVPSRATTDDMEHEVFERFEGVRREVVEVGLLVQVLDRVFRVAGHQQSFAIAAR